MDSDLKNRCGTSWDSACMLMREYVACEKLKRFFIRIFAMLVVISLISFAAYKIFLAPPVNAAAPIMIKIDRSETLADIGVQLRQDNVVRYPMIMRMMVRALGGERHIQSGAYLFAEPQNVLTVSWRLARGEHDIAPVKVIVPEDATVREIGDLLARKLAPFNLAGFMSAASGREGYLYPDTYYFYQSQDPGDVERAMEQNFYRKLGTAQNEIKASGKNLPEVLTMASIVVGEANTESDRIKVANILWKRISLGMPLQVDSPFGYVIEKPLTKLTHNDIATDSPYNTYTNKGLPPTPIGSPSLSAIIAVVTSTTTPFLYYMSDANGIMHYSTTFDQHRSFVQKYL